MRKLAFGFAGLDSSLLDFCHLERFHPRVCLQRDLRFVLLSWRVSCLQDRKGDDDEDEDEDGEKKEKATN